MHEKRLLFYFLWCELVGIHWSPKLQPIVRKYGCVVNALKHYKMLWLFDIVLTISCWYTHITYKVMLWWRRTWGTL